VIPRCISDFYSVRSYFSSFTSADRAQAQLARLSIDRLLRAIDARSLSTAAVTSVTAASGVTHHVGEHGESLPLFLSAEPPSQGLPRVGGRDISLRPLDTRSSLPFGLVCDKKCGKKREIAQRSNRTPERASGVLLRSEQTARPRFARDRSICAAALHRDGP